MLEGEPLTLPLTLVDTVEKSVSFSREDFAGAEPILHQQFWMDPRTELPRHRHPVAIELIGTVSGELDIVLQDTVEGPPTLKHLSPGEVVLVRQNVLHTLRNPNDFRIQGYAMIFILEENGTTIRE